MFENDPEYEPRVAAADADDEMPRSEWAERLERQEQRRAAYLERFAGECRAVLTVLRCCGEAASRRELREATDLDYSTVNDVLDSLVAGGLVRRVPDRNLIEFYEAVKEPKA